MANRLKDINYLPRIDNRANYEQNNSSLSRLSNELNTMGIRQEGRIKNKKASRKFIKKAKTQPKQAKQTDQIQKYSNELKQLKDVIQKQKLQRSLLIQQKLRKISKLSTQQFSNPVQSPRSQVNYITMSPPQQPLYNMYPPPPIYIPPLYIPYMPNYPYVPNSTPHSPSNYDQDYRQIRSRRRRFRQSKYQRNFDQYDQPQRYRKMRNSKSNNKSNLFFLKKNRQKLMKKWRAVVWAIIFTQLLPIYSKKIMKVRQNIFEKFKSKKFNIELTMMQKYIVKKCKPFFVFIANQKQFQLTMEAVQTDRMDNQKAQVAKKLINLLIQGLNAIKLDDTNQPATNPIEVIHMFCKHGGFVTQFMTQQQLDMVSISEKNRYLRLDRNMQISQIINFLCNKIILYNSILNPDKVDAKLFPPDNQIINKNFHFYGSIWYQLCLEVQDQYLCQVPSHYQIGNWRKLKQKLVIQPAKSLAANGATRQEDEMVSGLLGKKSIEQIFGLNFWRRQKGNLKSALQNVHKVIVDFHNKLKQPIKF